MSRTMTTTARACLFGGALFAAGVAAGSANAQGFAHDGGFGIIAADKNVGADPYFRFEPSNPLGFGNNAYANGDLLGRVTSTTDEVSITHNRTGSGLFSYSAVFGWAYVFAVSDVPVDLAWDFGAWGQAYLFVENLTDLGVVFDAGALNAGTATVLLEEGTEYRVRLAIAGNGAGGNSFARATVVEPCAADIDGNGVLNVDDIEQFVDAFLGGCP
ncbi:MAG: hypothetical protein DHS20C14_14400 [Phycisphaeraceae bacterium]|nr:MAG: hypothetical protein DHS20C14_14400 [Phycisphaeraceae bacterium]